MTTFLLRFEERVVQAGSALGNEDSESGANHSQITAGPKTLTEVKREGADADPGSFVFFVLPK